MYEKYRYVDVGWRPFQLNPDMGPHGENHRAHVARKYGMTDAQVQAVIDAVNEFEG